MSDAVNRQVPELRRRGVEAIVVLAHSGAFQPEREGATAAGEIVDETRQMSNAVDVVVAGHTHSYLNTSVAGKLVVGAFAYGSAYDQVELKVDRRSRDVLSSSAEIRRTSRTGIRADREVAAVVRRYARRVRPVANRVVATARRKLSREHGDLGTLVADAHRALASAELDPGRLYAVAANELIATGGRFSVLRDRGLGKRRVGTDIEALASYLERRPDALR